VQGANGGLTLAHYLALLTVGNGIYSSDLGLAIFNNLRFAGLALLIAVPLGLTHAFAVWRTGSKVLDALSILPLMVSATLLGVAYIVSFSAQTSSLWLLIAAYALTAYPFVTRAALTALRALEPGTLEAARADGAGRWALLRFVTLPIIAPALRVGVAFAFAVVIGEFGATLVLQRPEWATLTTLIFEKLSRPAGLGEASALSSVLLLLTATGFWAIGRSRSS
jgi:thiamine transport system permease protein